MNLAYVPMVCTIITTFGHFIWLLILVKWAELDILGLAIATTLTYAV